MSASDPDYGLHKARTTSGQRQLFAAILAQVVADLFSAIATNNAQKASNIRADALKWLTVEVGPVAEDRSIVCNAIDVDPDLIRATTIKILEAYNPVSERDERRLSHVHLAREMWDARKEVAARGEALRQARKEVIKARREAEKQRLPDDIAPEDAAPVHKVIQTKITGQLITQILDAIRAGNTTLREMNFYFEGELSQTALRRGLSAALDAGLVRKDGFDWLLCEQEAA
ncbi:MAG: hypothetical protein ABJ251_07025 [Paracoccaceae bacterium]